MTPASIASVTDARRPVSPPTPEQILEARRRHEQKSDALYISGAILVVIGVATLHHGLPYAAMAAGAFCLLFPCSEFLISFIRGVRPQKSR